MRKFLVILCMLAVAGFTSCGTKEPASVQSLPDGEPTVVEIPADALQALKDAQRGVPEMIDNVESWPLTDLPPAITDTSYDIYAVTLLWGQLGPVPNTDGLDWSGTLGVNGEAVVHVMAPIDFEPGQDSVLPHDAVHFAAWQSYTQGDLDGIACLVYLKRGVVYVTAPWLRFETGPFTIDWDFGQLEQFAAWYPVEPSAGLAIYARKLQINRCPTGTFDGSWIKADNTGDSGWFGGIWKDAEGEPINSYAGQFWTNNDGTREFQGVINGLVATVVLGDIQGTWYYDDPTLCPMCGQGRGIMEGTFRFGNNTETTGKLVGVFGSYGTPFDQLELPLTGVWRERCVGLGKWYLEDE